MIDPPNTRGAHKCAYSSAVNWTPGEIRRRRNAKGWSQDDLAKVIGVSRRAITNWETTTARPSGANIEALDQALGDAPLSEPTLRGASDAEFIAEFARRLSLRADGSANGGGEAVVLPAEDLAWPRRTRKTRNHLHGRP